MTLRNNTYAVFQSRFEFLKKTLKYNWGGFESRDSIKIL